MTKDSTLEKLRLPNVLILLSVIILSCTFLIFINYFTIKILSSTRAYVNGESHYSKGQKDAVRHLITYLYTEDRNHWKLFKEELSVPEGDGAARNGLITNSEIETIKNGLRAGRNHEDDLDDMIWLFQNFGTISFFEKAINEWEKGDALIDKLSFVGYEIDDQIQTSQLDENTKQKFLTQISSISDKLTVNERNFSNTLGKATREIKGYLIYANIFFILIIICSVTMYYAAMVKKLTQSKQEIETKNNDLTIVNRELDRFVYSASHDLRSPISSLKGLVDILKTEDDPEEIQNYLELMDIVLDKQDQFIRDIIDYSRNKRTESILEPVSLKQIIDDAVATLQYIDNVKTIDIEKHLAVDRLYSDDLRLKIIINNLLSNAIKYADFSKEKPFISISTFRSIGTFTIEVKDNGIGINKEVQSRIFDMFFVTNKNKGTGLGLYIVKESVEMMKGTISVESEIKIGSKFIITLPYHNEG
ncbi:MAG: HAMP domain-containing sensor histidine kinase [Bacteroidota bacterium]